MFKIDFLLLDFGSATLKNSGQEVCLDPEAPWVKKLLNRILSKYVSADLKRTDTLELKCNKMAKCYTDA